MNCRLLPANLTETKMKYFIDNISKLNLNREAGLAVGDPEGLHGKGEGLHQRVQQRPLPEVHSRDLVADHEAVLVRLPEHLHKVHAI